MKLDTYFSPCTEMNQNGSKTEWKARNSKILKCILENTCTGNLSSKVCVRSENKPRIDKWDYMKLKASSQGTKQLIWGSSKY